MSVTTVFRTTTIVSTVHHTPSPPPPSSSPWTPSCGADATSCSALDPSEDVLVVVRVTATAADEATPSLRRTFPPEATPSAAPPPLAPTPTLRYPTPTITAAPPGGADQESLPHYWLLTVLRGPKGEEPLAGVLAARLARLYQKAFMRQQERHLGILPRGSAWRGIETSTTPPRGGGRRGGGIEDAEWGGGQGGWRRPRALDPVLVRILRVTKREDRNSEDRNNEDRDDRNNEGRKTEEEDADVEELELVYSVHVGGRAVPAKTAAEDMRLVTDEEAARELGYTVVTKAEPYLKEWGRPQSSNGGGGGWRGGAWAVAATAVAAGLLLLILAALLALLANRQRHKRRQRMLVSGAEPTDDVSALASSEAGRAAPLDDEEQHATDAAGGGRGTANRRQVFESGACTNLGYEATGEGDAKRVIRPAGASKGSWLPKHSDVFPAPSAPPRRPESAVSLDGERHPRWSGRKAQFASPPHPEERRHPPSSLEHHHRRLETGQEESEEYHGRHGTTTAGAREGVDSEEWYGGGGILRASSSKQRGRGGERGRRKRRTSAGRGANQQQQRHLSAARVDEAFRGVMTSPSPPPPDEDLIGVSDGEQDWTASPLPIHRSMASPTSYLSMPSVRAFPKGANIPEPLALVLAEGNGRHPVARDSVSIRHLDVYPEASAFEPQRRNKGGALSQQGPSGSGLSRRSRHGSIDGQDPGVLGPKVFEVVRRQRELVREGALIVGGSSTLQHHHHRRRTPEDNLILPLGEGARLRRRFHDLLDDTLILFGKRYGEQTTKTEALDGGSTVAAADDHRRSSQQQQQQRHLPPPGPSRVDFRSQSAYARAEEPLLGYMERPPRPKTSLSRPLTSDSGGNAWGGGTGAPRRVRVASAGPRGAWGPTDDSPSSSGRVSSTLGLFARPVSAGPYHHHHHTHVTSIPASVPHDSPPPPAPSMDTTLVTVDPQMPSSDPAIPLIQAIKAELRKFHSNDTPS
ncbi:uncharacterized protein LOC124162505 [Ischnura elegans]|uniref:uncharacterized protein LOC124162505 n=1 Tax=Ischnura elegans TaxID=197161 RepID=UPI001ED8BD41|nr:uncharacterized protein LOC124162505 [Ischnura elegans]